MERNSIKESKKASVWKLQAIQYENRVDVTGMIIRGVPRTAHDKDSIFSNFVKIVKSYFKNPYSNRKIKVHFAGETDEITTDSKGEFNIFIDRNKLENLHFTIDTSGEKLKVLQDYPVTFQNEDFKYLIISDIDDTILVSKSVRSLSKLFLMLFRPIIKRKAVEENLKAYTKLRDQGVQFSYVSGSENNLFHLIGSIFSFNTIPFGPIFLRPFVKWYELTGSKKVKEYKIDRISKLAEDFHNKHILLFGDDSQHDLDVFKIIVEKFPNRIKAIFLRKTGFTSRFEHKENIWKLNDEEVIVYYYNNFEDIADTINLISPQTTT